MDKLTEEALKARTAGHMKRAAWAKRIVRKLTKPVVTRPQKYDTMADAIRAHIEKLKIQF